MVLSSNLLAIAVTNFLTQISSPHHRATILVLDDLQWADQDSLAILRVIVHLQQLKNLLLIGIYRDTIDTAAESNMKKKNTSSEDESYARLYTWLNEVTVDEQGRTLPYVHDISVTSLDPAHTSSLVRHLLRLENEKETENDTLTETKSDVTDLINLIYRKTMGNPYYVVQFLILLQKNHLLQFNYGMTSTGSLESIFTTCSPLGRLVDLSFSFWRRINSIVDAPHLVLSP